ncbi:MAG TPA: AfsR/SARP family transcriptional regulator [Gaiellaceae bacterium]|nr:AfsR/SARP family transcriptional regulator [Gaiellaceae bacterium]
MEFRVLGPLEVRRDGRIIELRGSKRRAVLVLLILHANEVVRTNRLIDELWGEALPANASAALHNHVSRLRKDLGSEVLVTKPWGYVLRAGPEEVDVTRFERLIVEAKPLPAQERAAKLAEALSLWRGPALADLAQERALAAEIGRLEELRLSAIEQRIDADLELGRQEDLVPELEALIAEQPLRERLRGQLILALYRSGRQAEALETYRETRRVLVEELGIEPSAELRELERAILRQDPSLASAPPPPPAAVKAEPGGSRWRWPRSPLVVGAAVLLLAGAAAAAVVATREKAPHQGKAVSLARGAESLPKTTSSTSNAEPAAVTTNTTSKHASASRSHVTRVPRGVWTNRSVQHPARTRRAHPHAASRDKPGSTLPSKPSKPPQPTKVYWLADNFDDPAMDHGMWHLASHGQGVDAAERNGRLEFSISPDAVADSVYGVDQHYGTMCLVKGDFDAIVEYDLLTWPPFDGVRVTLGAYFPPPAENWLAVERSGGQLDGTPEAYDSNLGPNAWARTDDTTGALRLARKNGVLSGYYRYRETWVKFDSKTAGAPVNLVLSFNSAGIPAFGRKAAVAAFDNFHAEAESVECRGVPIPPRRPRP